MKGTSTVYCNCINYLCHFCSAICGHLQFWHHPAPSWPADVQIETKQVLLKHFFFLRTIVSEPRLSNQKWLQGKRHEFWLKNNTWFLPMLPPWTVEIDQMWRGSPVRWKTNLWQGHCASNLVPAIAWLLVCQVGYWMLQCFRTAPQNPGKFVADQMNCSCSMLIHNSVHFVSQKDHWLSFVTLSLPRIKRSKYCDIMCPLEEPLIVTEGFLWMASFGCSLYAWPSLNSSCPDVSGAWSQWEQLWRRQRKCDLLKVSKRIVDMFWLFGISDVVKMWWNRGQEAMIIYDCCTVCDMISKTSCLGYIFWSIHVAFDKLPQIGGYATLDSLTWTTST